MDLRRTWYNTRIPEPNRIQSGTTDVSQLPPDPFRSVCEDQRDWTIEREHKGSQIQPSY